MAFPLALGVAWRSTSWWPETLRWVGLYLLLTDVGPMGLLTVLARHGQVSNLHQARQRERLKPLLISLTWLAAAAVLFAYFSAPLLM